MSEAIPSDVLLRARDIRLLVLDVDGVLTDGILTYDADGESQKRFHTHDGLGIQLLFQADVEVAVVTARRSPALDRRLQELGIRHVRAGARDKRAAVDELAATLGVRLHEVCFAGDDVLDAPAMEAVGLAVAVPNAHPRVLAIAHWVTRRAGGAGAVRELADTLLLARDQADRAYERFLASARRAPSDEGRGFGVVIPARYGSARLPGKPLLVLNGKPLVVHVLDNAKRAGAAFVVVATDDARIAEVVERAGGEAMMTSPRHENGTDRLAEVVARRGLGDHEIVVNLQGDEPLLDPAHVARVAHVLATRDTADIATLAAPIRALDDIFDPNVVKVVVDHAGFAVAFSRAPIPWVRAVFHPHPERRPAGLPPGPTFLRHVGLYGYRVGALRKITAHPPVPLEQAESLEQLRALWLRVPIHVTVVDEAPAHGVDTPDDVAIAEELLRRRASAPEDAAERRPTVE